MDTSVELSLSPVFRRKWSSLYESLSDSKPPREKLMESYIERIPQIEQIVLAGDDTAWPRLEAFTLKERTYDHLAQPMSGSKPVTLGQGFQRISVNLGNPQELLVSRNKLPVLL